MNRRGERRGSGRHNSDDRIRAWQTGRSQRSEQGPKGPSGITLVEPLENGRVLAWAVLQEAETGTRFLQDLFLEFDRRHSLSSSDRALAVDIASGVMRRRRTLDRIIESRLARPRSQTEPELWQVLRIGTYQLLLSRTPRHAAVDSTVELCRSLGRDRWTGFVNGILRSVGRLQVLNDDGTPAAATGPARIALPTQDGQWLQLNEELFPDPSAERASWFGDVFSLPSSLAGRWSERFDETQLLRLGFHFAQPPVTSLRVNPLRSCQEDVVTRLQQAGVEAACGSTRDSVRLQSAARIEQLPGFQEGHWSIQDESAMSAARLVDPKPGEMILDMCAAPGGKTTHLAELSGDAATIIACDVSDDRLERIRQNAARLQLNSIQTLRVHRDGGGFPDQLFDAVLVDVPCSNSGVLNRRPEARWRFDANSLAELVQIQTRLLILACERTRPGGRVVYSTCSLEPEENDGVVRSVLTAFPDFVLTQQTQHLPGHPADGAYQARLERKSDQTALR